MNQIVLDIEDFHEFMDALMDENNHDIHVTIGRLCVIAHKEQKEAHQQQMPLGPQAFTPMSGGKNEETP